MLKLIATIIMGVFINGCKSKDSITVSRGVLPGPISRQSSLQDFTGKLLGTCKAQASEARKTSIIAQASRVAKETFLERSQQEAFLLMVCIESKFDGNVRSKAGAVGYTQIMPKYAQDFSTACGMGKINAADLSDGELNLKLGACQFKKLLDRFDGNVALALSGYNSGPDSTTTKSLNNLGEANPETGSYISKFYVLQNKME